MASTVGSRLRPTLADYGMLWVLAGLCAAFSLLTWTEQRPEGAAAGEQVAGLIRKQSPPPPRVIILVQPTELDARFAAAVEQLLRTAGEQEVTTLRGDPRAIRRALIARAADAKPEDVYAVPAAIRRWPLLTSPDAELSFLRQATIYSPQAYSWPTFLRRDNLLNISNQIAEIAIVAVGMTMVIIAGGIDLSVGSLLGLSAMVTCVLIQNHAGGREATPAAMTACAAAGIGVCGLMGLFTGTIITRFRVPPFVVTLGVMLAASGIAGMLTGGAAAHIVPDSFTRFASGRWAGAPHAVWLMLSLYLLAHLMMGRTRLGRYLYAVGGNRLAAHLSGIRTERVLMFAYVASGLMAGLAGVVMASRLKSANPTFGKTYELYVIAAVVVGGTSLSGGSGRMLGTLIGALIIAVMQNGMNLLNGLGVVKIDDFGQSVVLGVVLLLAVVLDQWRQRHRRP